ERNGANSKKPTSDKYLVINLRISNLGVARKIDYRTWREPGAKGETTAVKLSDNSRKGYRVAELPADVDLGTSVQQASMPPAKPLEDILVFEAPPKSIEYLHLELPASAFGASGKLRFEIPRRMIWFR